MSVDIIEQSNNDSSPILFKQPVLKEADLIKVSRAKTYKHWPHKAPNEEVMSANGWFYCRVNDRTICIYCDTICHNWEAIDDPYEVHARLAPDCPFIRSISKPSSGNTSSIATNSILTDKFDPYHKTMCQLSRREKSFDNPGWTQTSPSAEILAIAGFFYPGVGNTVTCFYCNGSLHKWSENDNPKVEHARWFPNCLYAKHLCGNQLYMQIQIMKQKLGNEKTSVNQDTLLRLVNARLDLPVVERLRLKYSLSIIKRCIEDQLRMDQDDFQSDNDLSMACFILQKQIDVIQGNPNKIITPSQNYSEAIGIDVPEHEVNECIICLTEKKQLACMPCGHFCVCVVCGYALQKCPICRENIQSLARIYC